MTLDELLKRDPVLLLYPAGTGGEHIAHTMSLCSTEFEPLKTVTTDKNQFKTLCAINYSANVTDISNIYNCINPLYIVTDEDKRLIFKDHPIDSTLLLYRTHFPNIKVIMITPFNEFDYFAELTFKKLKVAINVPIDRDSIGFSLTDSEFDYITSAVKGFNWIWKHELESLITNMRCGTTMVFNHNFDPTSDIKGHRTHIIDNLLNNNDIYSSTFKNYHIVNCDCLRYDSLDFWTDMQSIIPSIDVSSAIPLTNKWISKNNKLEKMK